MFNHNIKRATQT